MYIKKFNLQKCAHVLTLKAIFVLDYTQIKHLSFNRRLARNALGKLKGQNFKFLLEIRAGETVKNELQKCVETTLSA